MFLILDASPESALDLVDEHAITTAVDQASTSREKYTIYIDDECYKISEYTSEYGLQLQSGN